MGNNTTNNRFKEFSDDEIYMLSRQAIEGSFEIVIGDKYSKEEKQIHSKLINELADERKKRGV